ncbi:cytochrome P450 oxidoreductase GliC [Elsinoe ampelina]|uniref:Cytochrome P450 oxidoreductase GliC n=1 Tax=Elsinoe ampelina TaxID=302913 RepID=A0A6A6G0A6_9PEZI|nr:cytochrome P450 oxidoreductase GliC [Elsinoe ampelina]
MPYRWPNGQGKEKFFDGIRSARKWRTTMGPVYQIWAGDRREIVLTRPDHAAQYFRDSHRHVKATNNNSGWLFGEVLGECVGLVSLERWQNLRSVVETAFSRPSMALKTTLIISQAQQYLNGMGLGSIGQMDPAARLQFYPFFVVAQVLFGQLSDEQTSILAELAPLREELFREVIRGGINRFAIARYVPWSGASVLRDFQSRWSRFVEQSYILSRDKKRDVPVTQLWQAVLVCKISKKEALQTLDESLYANLDVTTSAISWNIILLAQHVGIQQQLRDEIRANGATSASYIDNQHTLLAACILEASRLRPILAFSNPEHAIEDKLIDGYLIPRHTDVIVDATAINVENPFWENGTKYMPHRFLSLKPADVRYNLWRFGFGPRKCLGQHLADRMLRALTAALVSQYYLDCSTSLNDSHDLKDESWVGLPNETVHYRRVE